MVDKRNTVVFRYTYCNEGDENQVIYTANITSRHYRSLEIQVCRVMDLDIKHILPRDPNDRHIILFCVRDGSIQMVTEDTYNNIPNGAKLTVLMDKTEENGISSAQQSLKRSHVRMQAVALVNGHKMLHKTTIAGSLEHTCYSQLLERVKNVLHEKTGLRDSSFTLMYKNTPLLQDGYLELPGNATIDVVIDPDAQPTKHLDTTRRLERNLESLQKRLDTLEMNRTRG
jgi:hypothetical protein